MVQSLNVLVIPLAIIQHGAIIVNILVIFGRNTDMDMPQNRDIASSLIKALDVMAFLNVRRSGATASDLADMAGLPRTTSRRILHSLIEYGLVEAVGNLYRYTPAFETWSQANPARLLQQRYRPTIESIAKLSGELVLLGQADGQALVHLDFIEADHAVRVAPAPATRHPLNKTAQGKLILSRRPDWAKKFRSPKLHRELEEIARTGISWNRQESDPEVIAVAMNGFDRRYTDPVIAIAWPSQRFNEQKAELIIKRARRLIDQHASVLK